MFVFLSPPLATTHTTHRPPAKFAANQDELITTSAPAVPLNDNKPPALFVAAAGSASSSLLEPMIFDQSFSGPIYNCANCGRKYQAESTLKRHMRSECNQPKKFVCRICDRGFHHNFKLADHYRRLHNIIK